MGGSKTSSSTSKNVRARWSKPNSLLFYSEGEIRTLTPVRERVEDRAATLDLRDVFLCHAWDDRGGSAKELHDRLEDHGVKVWFSEKDVQLGSGLLREIDKGLAKSRIGIVRKRPVPAALLVDAVSLRRSTLRAHLRRSDGWGGFERAGASSSME
jgi:hypothetical protein